MIRFIHPHRTRHLIATVALALPSVVFASSSPATVANQGAPESRLAPAVASSHDRIAPAKGALLGAVIESLAETRGQEASPFEPPGPPPDRPPDNPGHNNPPDPPGKPADRPPVTPGVSHRGSR